MRKKQHRKIDPHNKEYDKYYIINYLVTIITLLYFGYVVYCGYVDRRPVRRGRTLRGRRERRQRDRPLLTESKFL